MADLDTYSTASLVPQERELCVNRLVYQRPKTRLGVLVQKWHYVSGKSLATLRDIRTIAQ